MIDNYYSQYENIIRPREYSIKNLLDSKNIKDINYENENYSIKSSGSINKSKTFRKNTLNRSQENIKRIQRSNSKSSFINSDDVNYLKSLLNEEMKKNMNLRHEIQQVNLKLLSFEKNENDLLKNLKSLKIEKDMNSKYILKMETLIKSLSNELKINKRSKIQPQKDKTEDNFVVNKLNLEIENLNGFKKQVYDICKMNDEININILNTLKDIQLLFVGMNKDLDENKFNKYDFQTFDKFKSNFF